MTEPRHLTYMDKGITIYEYIWRNCYQIVCWEKQNGTNQFPDVFGCGFMIKRGDIYVFITADHVVHKKDHDEGYRTGQEYKYALVNNQNVQTPQGVQTILSDMPDFSYCDGHDLKPFFEGKQDMETTMIPDMIDISYCKIRPPFKCSLLTSEFRVGEEVLCKDGMPKLYIANEVFAEVDPQKEYIILGTLGNKQNGIRWDRVNALHRNIHYLDKKDNMLRFTYTDFVSQDEWEGLSGSPIFSCDGELVGMIVRAVEGNSTLWVYPIQYIMDIIDKIESIPGY